MKKLHDFSFSEAPDLGVYVCHHVSKQGLPILHVTHDADGDWQFLCGGDHSESAEADFRCLEHVVADDPSVNELAGMGCNSSASRESVASQWVITDDNEQIIRDNIAEYGWHLAVIHEDDEGPGFVYSIGMEKTLGSPEIIMFGLPAELMGSVINDLGDRVRDGATLRPDEPIDGLLEGASCILKPVAKQRYRDYFGYARWYYGGNNFRAWQCFWPGKQNGLFPWEPGSAQVVRDRQPDLSCAPPGAPSASR